MPVNKDSATGAEPLSSMHSEQRPVLVISGPTAVGKSDVAVKLAEALHAEILGADSRQIYRGMEVGTAAPETALLERVPHHFISEREPDEDYSAGQYARDCRSRIELIWQKGRELILCGGSGMYIEAVFGMLHSGAGPADTELRQRLYREAEARGWMETWKLLRTVDHISAEKIAPADRKRIIRALEIVEQSGQLPSELFSAPTEADPPLRIHYHLDMERNILNDRIALRSRQMIEKGLVKEVETLLNRYPRELNAFQTVGYTEIMQYLDGELDLEAAIEWISTHTRQYAKRQRTWFRKFRADRQFMRPAGENASVTAERIWEAWSVDSRNS